MAPASLCPSRRRLPGMAVVQRGRRNLKGSEALAVEGVETRVWTVRDPDEPERLRAATVPEDVRARFA